MSVLSGVAAVGAFALVTLVSPLSAQAATDVMTGSAPISVAVNESNHRVIVANAGLRSVMIFDGSEAGPTKMSLNTGEEAGGIAVDSGLQLAFVTLPAADKVAVVDLGAATPVVLRTLTVGSAPNSVAVDPILHRVFVVNNGSANVSSFIGDDATPTITTIAVGAAPLGIAVDTSSHIVFVASSSTSTVARFDGAAAAPVPTTIFGVTNAGGISVDTNARTVYVVDGGNGRLLRFSANEVTPTLVSIAVTGTPSAVLADAATGEVYVATRTPDALVHFDGTREGTPVFTTSPGVGSVPTALAIDTQLADRYVYVGHRTSTFVSRIGAIAPSAPVITSGSPPAATVGVPYSFTFTATGRPSPQFNSTFGLGAAFRLDAASGVVSGTPTAVGPITFRLEVLNGVAPSAVQNVTIEVNAAPTPTPTPTPTSTTTSTPTPTGTGTPGTGGNGGGTGTGAGTGGGTGGAGVGGSGGSGRSSGGGTGTGGLAHTGQSLDGVAPIGVAGLLLLAVGAAAVMERRARAKRTRS
ncbi:hypothetical protein [Subtercola sp. Z020]|uniref:hypothetical protein n=1 Tax=Subtercola sp. Z020 TaxID=2080582 RepID=UPI0011AFF2FE|nr:hypothetical protein [Subtercola sp. Z020]